MENTYSIAIPIAPAIKQQKQKASVEANTCDYNDLKFEQASRSYEIAYICQWNTRTPLQFLLIHYTDQQMENKQN